MVQAAGPYPNVLYHLATCACRCNLCAACSTRRSSTERRGGLACAVSPECVVPLGEPHFALPRHQQEKVDLAERGPRRFGGLGVSGCKASWGKEGRAAWGLAAWLPAAACVRRAGGKPDQWRGWPAGSVSRCNGARTVRCTLCGTPAATACCPTARSSRLVSEPGHAASPQQSLSTRRDAQGAAHHGDRVCRGARAPRAP